MLDSTNAQSPLIQIRGVSKSYHDKTVVDNVDLDVCGGEQLILVGHNGAGKTTLMKMVLGLSKATMGELTVLGGEPQKLFASQRRKIGYLPESVAFQGAMRGREVLAFYAALKGLPKSSCATLLDSVGLGDAADRRVSTYSKGMRQRLGLAQAILGQPQLLLLDEPTSGMDPVLRRQFYDTIDALRSAGTTAFISSHALSEVEARADRIAIMKTGRFVAVGTLSELADLATLPVSVQISVPQGRAGAVAERLGSSAKINKVNEHTVGLDCDRADKMHLLRRISDLGSEVTDMEITPPRLDEIYLHFMQQSDRL